MKLLRLIAGTRLLLPLTALLLRARCVKQSARFALREIRGGGRLASYDLRGRSASIIIRHGAIDAATVGEVFHERVYEPPPELAALRPRELLDLGANIGLFCVFAADRWPQAQITAYEPDGDNAEIFRLCAAINGATWNLHEAVAATSAGEVGFSSSADALSHVSTDSETMVPCEDVLALMAKADLVKMDIEGGEWELLRDRRFANSPPRAVVLEYHPASDIDDPRSAVIDLLEGAGLRERHEIFELPGGYGMLWAWRK